MNKQIIHDILESSYVGTSFSYHDGIAAKIVALFQKETENLRLESAAWKSQAEFWQGESQTRYEWYWELKKHFDAMRDDMQRIYERAELAAHKEDQRGWVHALKVIRKSAKAHIAHTSETANKEVKSV